MTRIQLFFILNKDDFLFISTLKKQKGGENQGLMYSFCERCGILLQKKNRKRIVVKKNKKGEWVEVGEKKHNEGVKINEKILFKCLNCDYFNKLL